MTLWTVKLKFSWSNSMGLPWPKLHLRLNFFQESLLKNSFKPWLHQNQQYLLLKIRMLILEKFISSCYTDQKYLFNQWFKFWITIVSFQEVREDLVKLVTIHNTLYFKMNTISQALSEERHAIKCAFAHTCAKVFRNGIHHTCKSDFDNMFLLHICLSLIKIFTYSCITIKQTAVID